MGKLGIRPGYFARSAGLVFALFLLAATVFVLPVNGETSQDATPTQSPTGYWSYSDNYEDSYKTSQAEAEGVWYPNLGSSYAGGEYEDMSRTYTTSCSWDLSSAGSMTKMVPGQVVYASITVSADAQDKAGYDVTGGDTGGVRFSAAYNPKPSYANIAQASAHYGTSQTSQGTFVVPAGKPGDKRAFTLYCYVGAGVAFAYIQQVYTWTPPLDTATPKPETRTPEPTGTEPSTPIAPPPVQPPPVDEPPPAPPKPSGGPPVTPGGGLMGGLLGAGAVVAGAAAAAAAAGAAGAAGVFGGAAGASTPSIAGSGGPDSNPNTQFDGSDPCSPGLPHYRVNTATLDLVVEDTVVYAENVGPALEIKLTYNSSDLRTGLFGRGWRLNYESSVQETGRLTTLNLGSGQIVTYRKPSKFPASESSPQELEAPQGVFDRLVDFGAYWVYFHKETELRFYYRRAPGQSGALLCEVADISGNRLVIQFDPGGRIDKIIDAAGRATSFEYSPAGRCTGFRLCDNRRASYYYNPGGLLAQAVDLAGIAAVYNYDAQGNLAAMAVDRDQRVAAFTYQVDQVNRVCLASVSDSFGKTAYQIIPGPLRHIRKTDPAGRTTDYYSHNYLTTAVVDSTGAAVQTRYANGLPVEIKDRSGGVYGFTYDKNGNLAEKRDEDGGIWRSVFDSNNHLLSTIDPGGRLWRYAYDPAGRPVAMASPGGEVETWKYDARGQVISVVDANGAQTLINYDRFGNQVCLTDPLGGKTQIQYDPQGYRLTGITSPGGNTTRFEQDANDRIVKVIHPDGAVHQFQYNCCAGIGEIDENGNRTQYTRDAALRLSETILADGSRYLFEEDLAGRTSALSDPLGRKYTLQYEAARRLDIFSKPYQYQLVRQYDPAGNLLNLWDENGNRNSYTYDPAGRMVSVTTPGGAKTTIIYAPGGLLQAVRNGRGQEVAFEFNPNGARETRRFWNGKPVAGMQYDRVGRLVVLQDGRGTTRYAYDLAGRLVEINYPDNRQVHFTYDPDNNLRQLSYPDGLVVSYQYDSRGRPVSTLWGNNSLQCRYDPAGNLLGLTRSNQTVSQYTYNANGAIQSVRHTRNSEILADLQYQRDGMGSPRKVSGIFPLKPEPAAGLWRSTIGPGNQVLWDGEYETAYDPDGNLVKIGGGRWTAVYDPENHLVDLQRNNLRQTFAYNALEQCVSRMTGDKVQNYYYDLNGRLLFETGANNAITARYIYMEKRLVAVDVPGTGSLFYHFDVLGNCLCLTDEAGKQAAAYAYQPFGLYQSRVETKFENPFTFVGEYGVRDEGDGLYLMGLRHYEGRLGRFVQPDPIGIAGGTNLYAYAQQNPITFIDPSGTWVIPLVKFVAGTLTLIGAVYGLSAAKKMHEAQVVRAKVYVNAPLEMVDHFRDPNNKTAENIVDKTNPNGYYTGPAQEVLDMGKTIGTTAAEGLLPGAKQGAGAVRQVVVEGAKAAGMEAVNRTLDSVANPVIRPNASGTPNLRPAASQKPGCKKK